MVTSFTIVLQNPPIQSLRIRSYRDIARETGLALSTVYRVLGKQGPVSTAVMSQLMGTYGLTWDQLFILVRTEPTSQPPKRTKRTKRHAQPTTPWARHGPDPEPTRQERATDAGAVAWAQWDWRRRTTPERLAEPDNAPNLIQAATSRAQAELPQASSKRQLKRAQAILSELVRFGPAGVTPYVASPAKPS